MKEIFHKRFNSLSDFHRVLGLPKPQHPMISLIELKDVKVITNEVSNTFALNFYKVVYKTNLCGNAKYGQNYYDFGEGGLIFTAPNQVFETPKNKDSSGYALLIHPDFLLTYPLAIKIKQYGSFRILPMKHCTYEITKRKPSSFCSTTLKNLPFRLGILA